jgi:3-methyladenine DNA glycosylase AlkD
MQGYFKTGKGEYGEGDIFIGVSVPEQRKIAKQFLDISFKELKEMLYSKIHEERLTSLLILVYRFEKADENDKKGIFNFLIKNRKQINNWDLVDLTAPKSIGVYLADKDKAILYKLVRSKNVWERRIAVMSTFPLIKKNEFRVNLEFALILLNDSHDLIQKAVGWMLREIGNRDMISAESFLKKHYKEMPRTMLSYAIEKYPEAKRQKYLTGKI